MSRLPMTQGRNSIWTRDSLTSASVRVYTSSMIRTSEWSLMPAKRCFPQNANIHTAKKLYFALCGAFSVSLITLGAQKVIIETCHQPVTFLNSQRIRDGVVTNARIATWLMTLQGRDVEARYAQNYKILTGKRACGMPKLFNGHAGHLSRAKRTATTASDNHRYFEENVCTGMPTAYVDGCSYNREGKLQAGAGVVWLNNDPCPPQQLKLGPQSSQYAEIAAILITLQVAATHKIRELLICTDSNYARLSFICHLTGWKRNGFKTANNKPVKHQDSSKQATPSSLNTTWSFIGKRSEVIHVNQDKTKT